MLRAIAIALIVCLGAFVVWHFFFPIAVGAISISVGAWAFVVASVVAFCTMILLLFILSGLAVFTIGLFGFAWLVIAVMLFPFIFPILLPLFVLLIFIALVRAKKIKNVKKLKANVDSSI